MSITINPGLEAQLRDRAQAEGLSIEAYVERLLRVEQQAEDEVESIILAGFDSGEAIDPGPGFWEERHRRLEERLKTDRG